MPHHPEPRQNPVRILPPIETLDKATTLNHGDRILVPGIFGEFYCMIVEAIEGGGFQARDDRLLAWLSFDGTHWTVTGIVRSNDQAGQKHLRLIAEAK